MWILYNLGSIALYNEGGYTCGPTQGEGSGGICEGSCLLRAGQVSIDNHFWVFVTKGDVI